MKFMVTEEEKQELIYELSEFAMEHEDECLFMAEHGQCIGKVNCRQCIRDNVEWEVFNEQVD